MRYEISYGKTAVPVYLAHATPLHGLRVLPESTSPGRANVLFAAEVDVEVFGTSFLPAYTEGDNSSVVATDSIKNFVLHESLAWQGTTLESLLEHLGSHLLATYPVMESLRVSGRELRFDPLSDVLHERVAGGDRGHASLTLERAGEGARIADHACGREGIELLKVTGSAFTSFVRDAYTTLPERRDRPLWIGLDVGWRYLDPADALGRDPVRYVASEQVRDVVATVFDGLVSESIQHLVHEQAVLLLERFPELASVSFTARNRTRDLVAESEFDPRRKVYTDPFPAFGTIRLTLARD